MSNNLSNSSFKNNIISSFFLLSCFCIPNFLNIYWGELFAFFLFFILLCQRKVSLPKEVWIYSLIYVMILILITINLWFIYYINSNASVYYLLRATRFLFWFIVLSIITKDILKFSLPFILQNIIPFIFIFHAVVIFIVYFNFFNLREPIMALSNTDPMLYTQTFRSSGMWGGFDSASTFMAIGVVYLMTIYDKNNALKFIYILILLLALFLTAARIGSALIIIAALVSILHKLLKLHLFIIFKYFIIFIVLISILLIGYTVAEEYQLLPPQFSFTVNRMFEIINSGKTTSTDTLITMYYLPDDDTTLILGNSLNSFYNEQSVKSDIEYIKFIWGVGLPITIILFLYIILGMIYLSNKYRSNYKIYNFFLILLIMIIVSAFKGEYFFAYRISTFYILIFWLSTCSFPSNNS